MVSHTGMCWIFLPLLSHLMISFSLPCLKNKVSIFNFYFPVLLMGLLIEIEFAILSNAFSPGNVSMLLSVYMQSGLFFDRTECLFKYHNFLYHSPQCHFNPCSCRGPSCPPWYRYDMYHAFNETYGITSRFSTNSQNQKVTEKLRLEGTSWDCLPQPPSSKQHQLEQVAQGQVQSGFRYSQGWICHNISWQPVPVFAQPSRKKRFFLCLIGIFCVSIFDHCLLL